jgi:hypothetical protein
MVERGAGYRRQYDAVHERSELTSNHDFNATLPRRPSVARKRQLTRRPFIARAVNTPTAAGYGRTRSCVCSPRPTSRGNDGGRTRSWCHEGCHDNRGILAFLGS